MEEILLKAERRERLGSREARRIRAGGRLPANIYGHEEANLNISVDTKEFSRFLEEGHRIATILIGDLKEPSVVKQVQYDALGAHLVHVDFTRIRRDEKIQVEVPIETVGVPKGITGGGVLDFELHEIRVEGLPADLPEHYSLNIEDLELGSTIRIGDLTPPPNCAILDHPELVVIAVIQSKRAEVVAPVEAEPTQPELITKKKEEAEEPPEPESK